VLSDPKLTAYRTTGMKKSVSSVFNARSLRHGMRATSKGFVQGMTRGTGHQQGGVMVLAPGNELLYAYKSAEAGDHPDPSEVIAAIPSASKQ